VSGGKKWIVTDVPLENLL